MQSISLFLVAFLAFLASPVSAFMVATPLASRSTARSCTTTMGPAKDGPFTPAVRAARLVLGDQTLLKLRGKAIGYHSQIINQFCADYGVPKKLNQGMIKKAKIVGADDLRLVDHALVQL